MEFTNLGKDVLNIIYSYYIEYWFKTVEVRLRKEHRSRYKFVLNDLLQQFYHMNRGVRYEWSWIFDSKERHENNKKKGYKNNALRIDYWNSTYIANSKNSLNRKNFGHLNQYAYVSGLKYSFTRRATELKRIYKKNRKHKRRDELRRESLDY